MQATVFRRRFASAVSILAVFALGACAVGGDPRDRLRAVAKPGEIVAVELAMARAIREEGPLEGSGDYAASGVPAAEVAASATSVTSTQPRLVLASCDGTLSVARGEWQGPDSAGGAYSTVWQRQSGGSYRWLARTFRSEPQGAEPDEFIATRVASCDNLAALPASAAAPGQGVSDDGTLRWQADAAPGGTRSITVELWNGTTFDQVGQP